MNKQYHLYPILVLITVLISISVVRAQNTEACADTSYRIRFSSPGKDFYFYTHCNTRDGGTVLMGKITDTSNAAASQVVTIKLGNTGEVIWKHSLTNLPGNGTYFSRIMEQSNGEIAAYGYTTSFNSLNTREIILLKLDPAGTLLWSNKFSLNDHFASNDLLHPYFLSEGMNNDLLVSIGGQHVDVTSDSVYAVMARINNTGNIVWSKALTNGDATWWMNPSGIFESNGEIITLGHIDNTISPCNGGLLSIYALKMNYSDGQPVAVKTFCFASSAGDSHQAGGSDERDWFNSVKLDNGRFALFGRISTITDKYYGYKLVVNNQLDLVQATSYNVPANTGWARMPRLSVLPDGTTHFYFLARSTGNLLYWASLDSADRIIRQRKMQINDNGLTAAAYLNIGYRNSETYNFSTNYWLNNRRFSLFTQVQHNDPTIDSCLGVDTSFVGVNPINYYRNDWHRNTILDDPLIATPVTFSTSDFPIQTENLCTQVSRCDSLHIGGVDTLCVTNSFVSFIGLKNPECRKRVLWKVDNTAVDSLYQPNDSTLLIRFKQPTQNAQTVTLYASAANCSVANDSKKVVLIPGPTPLTSDTTVCGPFNIRLSPGRWGKSYRWQNGSTDSVVIATTPGSYSVQVETFCGTIFSDTTNIVVPKVSLGPDITKCNDDTVSLHASANFFTYHWMPGENMSTSNDSVVYVYPKTDTQYIVSAQTQNGCTAQDTVIIHVLHSEAILLGADTSFCEGNSLVLHAPRSFKSYQWSTGSTASTISVSQSNLYSVKATDTNGCSSYDTIHILSIYKRPVVSLLPKNTVCVGQTDTLKTTNTFSAYLWSDGTSKNFLPVASTGIYWVQATDNNGCSGNDTTTIEKIARPPAKFLPADTVVCTATIVELKPTQNFGRYNWSNGSVKPSIEVSSPGLYVLTVKDVQNCTGTDSIVVLQKNCPNKIFFPSAFSPNNDGRNDQFKPFVQGNLKSYRLTMYNRWGQVVFTSTDHRKGWNGSLHNLPLQTGTFVWLCQYQFSGEKENLEKGVVTIVD